MLEILFLYAATALMTNVLVTENLEKKLTRKRSLKSLKNIIIAWTHESRSEKLNEVNFEDELPLHEHYQEYGCNIEKILYPYTEHVSESFYIRNQDGNERYNLPEQFIPEINENNKSCSIHQNEFSDEESDLIKISENIIIHGVLSEKVFDIPVYARKTKKEKWNV